jgi:hypothetical protein
MKNAMNNLLAAVRQNISSLTMFHTGGLLLQTAEHPGKQSPGRPGSLLRAAPSASALALM